MSKGEKLFALGMGLTVLAVGAYVGDKLGKIDVPCLVGGGEDCWINTGGGPDLDANEGGATARATGGTTGFEIIIDRLPLFDTIVEIEEIEIFQDGDVEYAETATVRKTTMMSGRVLALEDPTDANSPTYVVHVNNNGTPDNKTDDFVEPINLNDMRIYSQQGTNNHYYAKGLDAEYADCVTELKAGDNEDYQGCFLATEEGDPEAHDPSVLQNLYSEYISDDKCPVETFHIASNLTFGGPTIPQGGRNIFPETKTVSQHAARSIQKQVSSLVGKPMDQVVPIFATDPSTGKPYEWIPQDTVNLDNVIAQSDGKFEIKAPVTVSEWCVGSGSWQTDETPEAERQFIIDNGYIEPYLLTPEWYADNIIDAPLNSLTPGLAATRFNPDGSIQDQAAAPGING